MRLAFIHPSFTEQGGAENYLIAAMQGLAVRGHEIHLFTSDYDAALYPTAENANFTIHLIGGRGYMEGIGGTLRLSRQLPEKISDYDLVLPVNFPAHIWAQHIKNAPLVWLCFEPKRNLYPRIMYAEAPHIRAWGFRTASDYKGLRGKWRLLTHDPHVLLPYWMRSGLQRFVDKRAVGRIDHILTISDYVAEKIQQIYPHKPVENIGAGLPLPHIDAQQKSEKIILVPTRLEPIKNVEIVLLAAKSIQDNLHDYQIVIMGEGSERPRLEKLCTEFGLDDVVRFSGYVNNEERNALYARCSFVIYPSLAEPLGLPCIEAGLYAKAVIAAHQGGTADVIKNGETGLLVDMTQSDGHQLAQAVLRLIKNPDETEKMGKAARQYLEPIYGLENWAANLEAKLLHLHDRYDA